MALIPPAGTSAYKSYQRAVSIDPGATANPWSFSPVSSSGNPLYGSALGTMQGVLGSALRSSSSTSSLAGSGASGAGSGGSGSGSGSPGFEYIDADYAQKYGMSRETAYQEALSNSAYQRAVKDMQAAGLNPAAIFGAGRGSVADGVSYVSGASSGGSGGSSRSSGRSSSSGYLFSSSAYSVLSALGGIVGAAATKSAGGYWIGTSLTQGAMNALSALNRARK